ncbi:DUF6218 family protein [Amycolatopsis methanolica]|uniref:Uncharacterized protein n=1 Tax=Amycolatopsis methanolica 239 TaxID=1068978 RepID=A0A076MTF6_AMYME|nr:DUF6218 family protein [Amycolatopsis methanolica]AIJ24004.1 hypothetical protein AMETH_3912 [Amycolatopsis methanolica 239]
MTQTDELGHGLPVAVAELWAPGSVVVARGHDDEGHETIAIWHVSPQGAPTGAWIETRQSYRSSAETARRLTTLLERRAITAPGEDEIDAVVGELTTAAGLAETGWWRRQVFAPSGVFEEIARRRQSIEDVVENARAERKNVAALDWPRELPDVMPRDVEGVRTLAGIGKGPGASAGAQAITVARVLRWLVQLWTETEQVKNRRSYVRDALGEPEALPPSWLAAVRTASAKVLPL